MIKVNLKNINNHDEQLISLKKVPQVGETLQFEESKGFYLVQGITHVIENELKDFDVYIEAIDQTYWKNKLWNTR